MSSRKTSPVPPGPLYGPGLRAVSLKGILTAIAAVFAIATVLLVWYASSEFNAMTQLTSQLNSAGRLRMLSQHAALLTKRAAHGEQSAHAELQAAIREFDENLASIQPAVTDRTTADELTSTSLVTVAWSLERTRIEELLVLRRPMNEQDELELFKLATRTLEAAESNVALFAPRVQRSVKLVRVVLPASLLLAVLFVAGIFVFVRRAILQPLSDLEQLLTNLARGDLSARGAPVQNTEMASVIQHANHLATLLERNDQEHGQMLAKLSDSEMRHRTLWELSNDAIITIDSNNRIVFANPAVTRIFGHALDQLIGQDIAILQPERLRLAHREGMKKYLASGQRTVKWSGVETQALHKDGYEIQVELSFTDMKQSDHTWLVGTFRDISERKIHEEALLRSATLDSLTGLPNRMLLHDRIEQAIAHAKRHKSAFGVLYLDLDNFKIINDTLGHESGDQLLCEAARRLLNVVRDGDTVARVGGDEFVLLLAELKDRDDIDVVAQRALDAMSTSFSFSGGEGFVGVSIGASIYPDDASGRIDLLQHADIAMYRAKDLGRNNYQRFDEQMQARFKWRMSMEAQLRRALEADELVLHYQPQIDLKTGRVTGAEALIRWESPNLGRVSPVQFIPLAEETGLIVQIGDWVIDRACRDAAVWAAMPEGRDCTVAVNVSARQLVGDGLLRNVSAALARHQLMPHNMEIEVTESMVMHDPGNATEILRSVRDLGCKVALDDFGTGYSSLAYLKNFPIDQLKIDKSLISDVAIVRAVIQLARSFGFSTLAEGVEDREVLDVLKSLGCDVVQGYFYSRPIPLNEFLEFLRQNQPVPSTSTGASGPTDDRRP